MLNQKHKFHNKWLILAIIAALLLVSCSSEKRDWAKAESENTIQSYENFLECHPESSFANTAKSRLELLYFRKADSANTIQAFRHFLEKFPEGALGKNAKSRLEDLYNIDRLMKLCGEWNVTITGINYGNYFLAPNRTILVLQSKPARIEFNIYQLPTGTDSLGIPKFENCEVSLEYNSANNKYLLNSESTSWLSFNNLPLTYSEKKGFNGSTKILYEFYENDKKISSEFRIFRASIKMTKENECYFNFSIKDTSGSLFSECKLHFGKSGK